MRTRASLSECKQIDLLGHRLSQAGLNSMRTAPTHQPNIEQGTEPCSIPGSLRPSVPSVPSVPPLNQSIDRSINESIMDQPTNQPINQSINQASKQALTPSLPDSLTPALPRSLTPPHLPPFHTLSHNVRNPGTIQFPGKFQQTMVSNRVS